MKQLPRSCVFSSKLLVGRAVSFFSLWSDDKYISQPAKLNRMPSTYTSSFCGRHTCADVYTNNYLHTRDTGVHARPRRTRGSTKTYSLRPLVCAEGGGGCCCCCCTLKMSEGSDDAAQSV